MTLEIRLHGRGGQGGVTCAKILAAAYARLGRSVQTFGDYAGERSGAPVRAYTRVDDKPITNRNKVYAPDQVLILDPTLLGDDTVRGLVPGGLLLVNTTEPCASLQERFPAFRVATVDATGIARRHGIGTRSVVIVNTTIAGAYARAAGLSIDTLEDAYRDLHLHRDVSAAREAYETVAVGDPIRPGKPARRNGTFTARGTSVVPLTEHVAGPATGLKTGSWRTQAPRYVERLAPCNAWCPAGNDIVGFVQALARGADSDAGEILARTQPLPSVCGRVCPAPCMAACNRREIDGAVNIRSLERWVGDRVQWTPAARRPDGNALRLAVVGSGPAGLSAAYALAREGHRVTIFEGEEGLGGVLRTGIPSYRLPRGALDRDLDRILALGVTVRTGEFLDETGIAYVAARWDGVIVAAGQGLPTGLDLAGAGLDGIEEGVSFLHRVNLEGGSRLEGHVLILGGGNTAIDCARSALRSGAARVTVAYRRSRNEMPAIPEEIDEAAHEGVEFLFQKAPVRFHGNGRVEAVELAEVELGEPDQRGRARPVVTERTAPLACDRVLLALGQSADPGLLPSASRIVQARVETPLGPSNVFAAGDYATGEGTVAHAIGDGRRVAARLLAGLGVPGAAPFLRPDPAAAVLPSAIRPWALPSRPPAADRMHPAIAPQSFEEMNLGLSDAREAERCYSCGHCTSCDSCLIYCPEGLIGRNGKGYEVDLDCCKGCGICAAECPRAAMEMTPV